MTASDLALSMLNGRNSAWLSVKQTTYLRNLIIRETRNPRPGRVLYVDVRTGTPNYSDGIESYQLAVAPNGAGLLKPVGM